MQDQLDQLDEDTFNEIIKFLFGQQKFLEDKSEEINQFHNPTIFVQNQKQDNQNSQAIPQQCNQNPKLNNKDQEQEQEQEDKKKELELLEVTQKFQKLIDEFNKNKKQNMSVVLLVGVTGSGKSTIFNFLSGADFIFNHKQELEIRNPSKKFSKMASGMNSVTKEPNFYHNQINNHLIIDFPGFQDTNGEQDQLLFELLFHKIVTSGPIKVIYVIKNLESTLPNRGSDLQEFINQLCLKGNINIEKFNLLLNCYLENLSDLQLQNKIKDDLQSVNKLQSIDKILVLRKAKNDNELQENFNNQQRQMLWQQIEQMQSIKIQPQKLPKSIMISDYLRSKILNTIEKYGIVFSEFFQNKLKDLSNKQSEATTIQMKKLLDLVNKIDQQSSFEWYTNYIQTCEQLANSLSIQDDIVTSSKNFIKILKYYSQFSNIIQGYNELKILQIIAKDQLNNMNKLISQRLEILKTKEQINVIMSQQKEDQQFLNSIMIQQEQNIKEFNSKINLYDQKIGNYEQQIRHLQVQYKDKTSEIKLLNQKVEEAKKIKSSLNKQQQDQQNQIKQLILKMDLQSEHMNQMKNRNEQEIKLITEQHKRFTNQMYEQNKEQTNKMINEIKELKNQKPKEIHHYNEKIITKSEWCQIF